MTEAETALAALAKALEAAEPALGIQTAQDPATLTFTTTVSLEGPTGLSRMRLHTGHYKAAAHDPEIMARYARRILAQLRKEVGVEE